MVSSISTEVVEIAIAKSTTSTKIRDTFPFDAFWKATYTPPQTPTRSRPRLGHGGRRCQDGILARHDNRRSQGHSHRGAFFGDDCRLRKGFGNNTGRSGLLIVGGSEARQNCRVLVSR